MPKGYISIRIGDKVVLLHRYVMEQYLGRELDPNEDVHHKNEDKTDNRIENLQVIDHGKHSILHNTKLFCKRGHKFDEKIQRTDGTLVNRCSICHSQQKLKDTRKLKAKLESLKRGLS